MKQELFFLITGLYISPTSVNTGVGENVTFKCNGSGSYFYWFINGVNAENITEKDKEVIGVHFSGDDNHENDYPYSGKCNDYSSYMTLPGNCLNNNTEIYCVILGRDFGNKTSAMATLTLEGTFQII